MISFIKHYRRRFLTSVAYTGDIAVTVFHSFTYASGFSRSSIACRAIGRQTYIHRSAKCFYYNSVCKIQLWEF